MKVNAAGDVFSIVAMEINSYMGGMHMHFVIINGVREKVGDYDRIDAEIKLLKLYNKSLTALDAMKEACGKN